MKNAVIVADDSELIRNIMVKALSDEFEVIEATNGREAVDAIGKKNNVSCLLLDLSMPKYNGFMVLDYFKNYNLFDRIPVFIISGDDSKETIDKAFTYDIVDMLNKPFSMENIKAAVHKASNLKK